MTMKRSVLLAALSTLVLAACASTGRDSEASAFPDPSRARPAGGTYVNLDDLRQYGEGMTKRQLYSLLGTPHFGEGMWGVRQWNYLFNLRAAPGKEPVRCQLQIQFNGEDVATGHAWHPASCGALLAPPAAPPPPPPPPEPVSRAPLQLSADALFAFDSAVLSENGKRAIEQALQGKVGKDVRLTVTGHTDRLGSANYNQGLSVRRAEAVRSHLVSLGIPASAIQAVGRGDADPVVQCSQTKRKELIDCLAPNRRVEIAGLSHR